MDLAEIPTERQVHIRYALSVPWLRKKRRLGGGPTYLRIGKMVRYRRSDIEDYLSAHIVKPEI